jgi:O-antigen/teichoic acid export membrane protein
VGLAQGREAFHRVAWFAVTQGALRVGGGIGGLALVGTVSGGTVGLAVGLVLAAAVAWMVERPPARSGPTRPALRQVAAAGLILLGYTALANVDVVLARAVLSPQDSGLYAAGSLFTKVAFWLPQFVPVLAFPRLSDPARRDTALRLALLAVGASGAAVTLGTVLLAEPLVELAVGSEYLAVAPLLGWFAALGAVLAVGQVSVYSGVARADRGTTALVWAALGALVVTVLGTATSVADVVRTAVAVATALLAVTGARELRRRPVPSPPSFPADGQAPSSSSGHAGGV